MTQRSRGRLRGTAASLFPSGRVAPIAKEHWTICTIAASARDPHKCLDWLSRLVALLPTWQHNGQHDITKRAQKSLDLAGWGFCARDSHVDSTTRSPALDNPTEPLPPHAADAEQALLGACIVDSPNVLPIATTFLEPRDFYYPKHSEIFSALKSFDGRIAPDFALLCDELAQRGTLQNIGGIPYLTRLIQVGAMALRVEEYCAAIYQAAFRREIIQACGRIAKVAYTDRSEIPVILDRSMQEIERVRARFAVDRSLAKPPHPISSRPAPIWQQYPR